MSSLSVCDCDSLVALVVKMPKALLTSSPTLREYQSCEVNVNRLGLVVIGLVDGGLALFAKSWKAWQNGQKSLSLNNNKLKDKMNPIKALTFQLRPLVETDIPAVVKIALRSTFHFSTECLISWSKIDPTGIKVAELHSGEIIGLGAAINHNENNAFVGAVCVHEKYRKLEIGHRPLQSKWRIGPLKKIEGDVQRVKREIIEVKSEIQEKISFLEKRRFDLEERPINSLPSSEVIYSRPTVKPLTFDGQTSWSIFKTSAAEVLQGIPAGNLTDLTTIERALESRSGDSHLMQFYRTELKTRQQKPGESLQVLAADVERLMSLAYAKCPLDIRESLATQYFIDAIRDEDTQHSTRLMDAKDLKSALAYSMKYEAARTVSKTSKHVRSLEVEDDSKNKEDKFESLFNRLEKLLNNCITEKKNATRRNPNVTCWQCNRKKALTEGLPSD
ncbi:CCHC-type domain-containing protein [Nephila pilipes]|uniref:CCHC-type domain-containing protein n=1 Tax=Nephila pilipes TaxID=299642 RepID=A0A8X6PGN0_NEPPI|nr:CCHC-type domain-containing protein [Nephila pilipes]